MIFFAQVALGMINVGWLMLVVLSVCRMKVVKLGLDQDLLIAFVLFSCTQVYLFNQRMSAIP
jgi:hypothetical protein